MTVPPTNNKSDDTARQPHTSLQPANRSTLDPVECVEIETKTRTSRALPPWAKEQIPNWGEKICVPEWDEDESLLDVEVGNSSGDDGMDDDYRSKNGWKVGDRNYVQGSK